MGFQAVHYAAVASDVHFVNVGENETVENIDFGRIGRDLPPQVFLSNESPTPLAGGSVTVQVSASDGFDTPAITLTANGNVVVLDANGRATVPATFPGDLILVASATDTASQTTTQELSITVKNADGSPPYIPNSPSLEDLASGAPQIPLHSPGAGGAADADTPIVATITHDNLTSWQTHYALVDDIDPYNLAAADADYVLMGSDTQTVINDSLGTSPLKRH